MPPTQPLTLSLHQALDLQPLKVTSNTNLNEIVHLMSQSSMHCHIPVTGDDDSLPRALPQQETSCVIIMDQERLAGILTEKDLVRLIATDRALNERTAGQVMSHPVLTLSAEKGLNIFSALDMMRQHHIHHLPVVDAQGRLLGLLTPRRLRNLMKPADFMRFRRVHEVMSTEVIHAASTASVLQIVRLMIHHRVSCVVITEASDATLETSDTRLETSNATLETLVPLGIITERDIVQIQRLGLDLEQTSAQTVMSAPLFLANPQNSLWEVDKMMRRHRLRRLVVADSRGHLLGVVTQSNLLPVDPVELYDVVALLQDQVSQLEAERRQLLEQRNQELEQLVAQNAARLQRRDHMLRNLALGVAAETGEDFWRSLVAYLTEALQVDYALVGKSQAGDRIQTLAVQANGQTLPNFEYDLEGTPCEGVMTSAACLYPQGVKERFSRDPMLQGFSIEGYLGVPLFDEAGEAIGLLAVMSRQPMTETDFMEEVLSAFATRASTKLARQKIEAEQDSFFSLSLSLLCTVGLDGYFKKLNPAFERILGYSRAELMATPLMEFIHPEDRAPSQGAIAQLAEGKPLPTFENRYICKDGSYRWFLWEATTVPGQPLIYATGRDITERKQMEQALQMKVKQQATVAELGQLALSGGDLDNLLNAAVVAIAQTLDIEYCKVLELLNDGKSLKLKAGVGWQSGLVGVTTIGTEQESQAGYALRSSEPVIVIDLQTDTRFNGPALLRDHQVISGISVIIQGRNRPYGVLGAHSTRLIHFTEEDSAFLQSVANILSQTIEQRHAQQVLKQSEQEYRTLTENLPAIVYRMFPEEQWRMDFLNNQCQTLTGFAAEELKYGEVCSIDALILEEDRPQVMAAMQAGMDSLKPFQVEYRIRDKTGNIRYMAEKGQPVAAQNDQPSHIDGVIFDVSERKQAEAAQQQSQEQIREQAALLDVANDAILVRDLEGRIVFWNKGAETIYGWSAEEALGQNADQLLNGSTDDNETTCQMVMHQDSWQGECQHVTKAGGAITVMKRQTIVKDEQGNPTSILSVNTDITEAKQLEAQFLRAQRLESIGTLASGIAHDLNNILTPIYGVAQLLSMQMPDASTSIKQQLEILSTSTRRGTEIIKQVLSFARGEEGDRTALNLKHLITEVRSFAVKTFPKSIDISINVPNDLCQVSADATQLYQVLMNLFVNAHDAMPNGGHLSLSATNVQLDDAFVSRHINAQAGPYICITVTDTGVGISADKMDRIFEPFFTTKQTQGGTGLGLSTVHGIVKGHGGFIIADSELGQGTQFKVYLPAIKAVDIQTDKTPTLPLGNGELVLVVDDEGAIREVVKQVLESYNYRVLVAVDGRDAIALYSQQQTDIAIVLMDINMPKYERDHHSRNHAKHESSH
jgi:PAS domain S-box-containing protein